MQYEEVILWPKNPEIESKLVRFYKTDDKPHPAMLIVPGGGYGCLCESTEGFPVAERFRALGFQIFMLRYRLAPKHHYPEQQEDILRAIKWMRYHAEKCGILKNNIAVCGFSAGGHLCACAGTLYDEIKTNAGDVIDNESGRPDAMLLAYPVITFGPKGHLGSGQNLLGNQFEAKKTDLSLENKVTENTPPTFIWCTATDAVVPVESTILFANVLRRNHILCEEHIFPLGPHGMQLGYGRTDISQWPEQAKAFLEGTCGFRFPNASALPSRTVILTFDDAVTNHLHFVAPILKKYHFNATFFICRFDDEWRKKNSAHLLTGKEIKQLSDMGFDIGNHTWNHRLAALNLEQRTNEIQKMNDFLEEAGIPKPVSFAYPGGPYVAEAVPILKKFGIQFARIVEERPWNRLEDDPLKIPSYSLSHDEKLKFYTATSLADQDHIPVLLFHGVPDEVHEWVNTPPEIFEDCMRYLYQNNFRVMSLREYGQNCL